MSSIASLRHEVVVAGGGSAGISVAARLRRAGVADVAVVDPSERHFYQPLWTLVGGGLAEVADTSRPEATVMPKGATWIRGAAISVDPDAQTVTLADGRVLAYGFLVMAPGLQLNPGAIPGLDEALGHHRRAPRTGSRPAPLADPGSPFGYIQVDQHTLRSPRWPNVFALGDVANLPTSKTGAAIRKQAPAVAANLLAARRGAEPSARYDGYTSCPLVTARNRMLLAEFDYDLTPRPSFPFIDTMKPRYDMWLLKRYGLPALYWHGMLPGRV